MHDRKQEKRDAGQERCRIGGMQDRRDAGKEICGNERSRKEGCGKVEKQERRDAGKEGCRKGEMWQ